MSRSRHWSVVVVIILLLVLTWLILDQVQPVNPLRNLFTQVLSPLQLVTKRASMPLLSGVSQLRSRSELLSENEKLRDEVTALQTQLIQLQEADIENETLRRQLDFKSAVPSYQLLSSEVIGHDPNAFMQYVIIDRGADDGLAEGMPVLTDAGLVGRISRISANSARVMLISDPSSSVSAIVQRSRASGIVRGDVTTQVRMIYIPPEQDVQVGDVVLTSGLGANFPRRLVIGRIAEVARSDVGMFQEAIVATPQHLNDLQVVMVLLNFADYELAGQAAESSGDPDAEQK